jgi:Tfp pilus assembly protein PilX
MEQASMKPKSSPQAAVRRHHQRGAGSLIVMMLLLFSASVVAFYLNRNLLVEQKVSANQVRSTTAFEVAEAGLEWAVGMLNTPTDINTACAADISTNVSFRKKYVQTGASGAVAAVTTTFPGCKISGSTLTCNCPAVPVSGEAVAGLGTTSLPSFTVAFENVQVNGVQDTESVRITATGCTAQAGACKPATTSAATTGNSDAWAQVSQIVKVRPLLRAVPASSLVCGTSCSLSGSYNVINTDLTTNGQTINAGSAITTSGGVSVTTLPGQPVANSQIANDTSLSSVANNDLDCSDSAMFKTFFGSTLTEYIESTDVAKIPGCTEPSACGALINAAVLAGHKDFYFPDGMSLNSSAPFASLGTSGAGNGVTIVSPAAININGNITIYGMIFSNSANVNDTGTGTANINGAMITCAGYQNNGNGTLNYDSDALGGRGSRRGPMVRVPGSWRDFTP